MFSFSQTIVDVALLSSAIESNYEKGHLDIFTLVGNFVCVHAQIHVGVYGYENLCGYNQIYWEKCFFFLSISNLRM